MTKVDLNDDDVEKIVIDYTKENAIITVEWLRATVNELAKKETDSLWADLLTLAKDIDGYTRVLREFGVDYEIKPEKKNKAKSKPYFNDYDPDPAKVKDTPQERLISKIKGKKKGKKKA